MSNVSKRKKESKTAVVVRVVSLALAALMVLSVVLASLWKW